MAESWEKGTGLLPWFAEAGWSLGLRKEQGSQMDDLMLLRVQQALTLLLEGLGCTPALLSKTLGTFRPFPLSLPVCLLCRPRPASSWYVAF